MTRLRQWSLILTFLALTLFVAGFGGLFGVGGPIQQSHAASTLVVNTTADISSCTTQQFSLRCASTQANTDGSGDTITFHIPSTDPGCTSQAVNGSPVCTISATSSFLGEPELTASNTTINGYTQPGARPNQNPLRSGDNAILTLNLDGGPAGNVEF